MPKKFSLVRFHTHLSACILATFVLLGSLAGLLLIRSAQHLSSQHNRALTIRLTEQSHHLDSALARISDHIRTLRATAQIDAARRLQHPPPATSTSISALQYDEQKGYFHLDALQHPSNQKHIGSLTGLGHPTQFESDTIRELDMALNLYPSFAAASHSFIQKPWFYYISARNFLSLYPWQPSDRYHFAPALLKLPLFTGGEPAYNPSRQVYWPQTPFKSPGNTSTSACAAPIYNGDQFLGVLAMNFNLHELFTSVTSLAGDQGTLLLFDKQEHLLASSTPFVDKDHKTLPRKDILPIKLRDGHHDLMSIPAGKMQESGPYTVLRLPLLHAPWQLVFFRQNPTWFQTTLQHLGSGPTLLLMGLILLVLVWMLITHIYISRPSKFFLEFILALSRRQPRPAINMPRCWKPWFNTVESIFINNENLTEQIACQNQLLEKRVAKRTRDLSRANAALRKVNRRLQTLSLMDGLTQLANYAHFEGYLKQMWELMQHRQEPLSLLLCDVDYFKQYNDTYGHQAGNQCLQAIAGVLSELAYRSSDLAARYGGEEFLLLLPGLDNEKTNQFARRLQQHIADKAIPHAASKVAPIVTVSIGVASIIPASNIQPQQLFEQADKALYRAKSKGRNCIA